jgi:hypothetical protein
MTTRQKTLTAVLLGILLAAGGVSWFFMRSKGLVDETVALQSRLLAGELKGRDRAAGVMQVTRNIDKMERRDVKKVRDAFSDDTRRILQQGIDEYFAAAEAERESLLDRDISRLATAADLWFATNPNSNGQPPRPRKPKTAAVKPEPAKGSPAKTSPAARMRETYLASLVSRAGKRGIAVPDWLLGPR